MGFSSVKKAYYYLKRNGIEDTFYACLERLLSWEKYTYKPVSQEEKASEMSRKWARKILFSIVVPAYETKEEYLRELVESVIAQTYPNWELIIADSSTSDAVKLVIDEYEDRRIRYLRLAENRGISANTNAGIVNARGEYIGLLDHDDIITPDALYEFASKIEFGLEENIEYAFIYSDEDKCDSTGNKFFEPNFKPDFNLDLLLTNNYVCHFLMVRGPLIKKLLLRSEYDGAQDHDLVLRAYAATNGHSSKREIGYGHIPKVLYHWRCHEGSTASNPRSKRYAYNAGRRAIADYLKKANIHGEVKPLKHNGFFRVKYKDYLTYPKNSPQLVRKKELTTDIRGSIAYRTYLNRFEIGAIGGPIIEGNKIITGIIDSTKTCPYDGMNVHFSGYMHRAVLQQTAPAVDIRNMMISESLGSTLVKIADDEEYIHLFNRDFIDILKERIAENALNSPYIDVTALLCENKYEDFDYLNVSWALCREIAMEGYTVYYDPKFVIRLEKGHEKKHK